LNITEEVIIGTKSNAYLKEHQAKYPAYHFTIGGKGPLPESEDPFDSAKVIKAPIKKHSAEEENYLKEQPKNHKSYEDDDEDPKEWSKEGVNFSIYFILPCVRRFRQLKLDYNLT